MRSHHRRCRLSPILGFLLSIAAIIGVSLQQKNHRRRLLLLPLVSSQFVDEQHCESIIPYWYDSGNVFQPSTTSSSSAAASSSSTTATDSTSSSTSSSVSTIVSYPTAPWIQLNLSTTSLSSNAKLVLVGQYATQEISSASLHSNYNSDGYYSAMFQGDTVSVSLVYDDDTTTTDGTILSSTMLGRLFSSWTSKKPNKPPSKGASSSRVIISSINVGLCGNELDNPTTTDDDFGKTDDDGLSPSEFGVVNTTTTTGEGEIIAADIGIATICGTDDRVPSNDVRQGRMGGCTAWLVNKEVFLRAGHCGVPNAGTRLHFTREATVPPPEDQYALDLLAYRFKNGDGEDWAVGRLLPNSITAKLPGDAQSAKCGTAGCGWYTIGTVPTSTTGNRITITGYGSVSDDDPRDQETHTGDLLTITGTKLKYNADTGGGNSGSPVIHANTGKVIGIHNAGGCTATGGRENVGQRIDVVPALLAHIKRLTSNCTRNADCDDGNFCTGVETCVNGKCVFANPVYTNGCPTPKPTGKPTFKPTATRKPTAKPSTRMPTFRPTTPKPTTATPSTRMPTFRPTTPKPTTATPSTRMPTSKPTTLGQTLNPTTQAPTSKPTTAKPTTSLPSSKPTTANPTSKSTTLQPTFKPTTATPTTRTPTSKPTTAKPTTRTPTAKPTITSKPATDQPTPTM